VKRRKRRVHHRVNGGHRVSGELGGKDLWLRSSRAYDAPLRMKFVARDCRAGGRYKGKKEGGVKPPLHGKRGHLKVALRRVQEQKDESGHLWLMSYYYQLRS